MDIMLKDHNLVLNLVKNELIELTRELTADTFLQTKQSMQQYLEFYEDYKDLPFAHADQVLLSGTSNESLNDKEVPENDATVIKEIVNQPESELKEVYLPKENLFIGQVSLRISGGTVGSFELYIPESVIRRLDLQEGDWVKATQKYGYNHSQNRQKYFFELIEPADDDYPSIRQTLQFAKVERDPSVNRLFIKSTFDQELPVTILLDERRLGNLHLVEGDIIDYAYSNNDYFNGRVIWKYDTETAEANRTLESKLLTKTTKDNKELNSKQNEEEIKVDLTGKKIVVAGFQSNKNGYIDTISQCGGECIFLTGDEPEAYLQRMIEQSFMSFVMYGFISHDAMNKIKEIAKDCQVKVEFAHSIGRTKMLRKIKTFLSETENNLKSIES